MKVFRIMEQVSQRSCNGVCLQGSGGYLVKQWLKGVVIVFVEKHYLKFVVRKALRCVQSAEASAHNNYTGFGSRGDIQGDLPHLFHKTII
jgi:hypothetical protein